jgi:2,3-bisphosphoglycerate-independent phosphoglycerate mutase
MKYIVVVPDGMADEPVEGLGGKTPLQAAQAVNMDYLAQHGSIGLVQTIPTGMNPGSDIGNMAILGYDPKTYHCGRAPLEAANQNIILKKNEIALRCNLITVTNGEMADYSAGHITTKEADELIKSLNKTLGNDSAKFYTGKSYRHLLVLKVEDPQVIMKIKTTPPHDILSKEIKDYLPKGRDAKILLDLMEQSTHILANHPINQVRADLKEHPADMIWLWGQGTSPTLPTFQQKFGLEGGIISAVDLVNGIGRLANLEVIDVPGITGYYDTNYLGKAQYALNALKTKDFVYIHIEAPDEAGHNGDVRAKIEAIEKVDKDIIGTILNHFDPNDDFRLLVLPDHPTPVGKRTHTADPVCYVMYGKGIPRDGAQHYNEVTAQEKGLKFESAEALLEFFLKRYLA